MEKFESYFKKTFDVGKCYRNNFNIYGASLSRQQDGSMTLKQDAKLKEIAESDLNAYSKLERSEQDIATPKEATKFRRAIGNILFVGRMSDPILLRIASTMATKVEDMKVLYLRDLKSQINYALRNAPVLAFHSTKSKVHKNFHVEVYTDGATGNKKEDGGREGYILFDDART